MRGRTPNPAAQAAKGNPGKRGPRKQTTKSILAAGQQRARDLATATANLADPTAPPAFLDETFGAALTIWREFAPKLHRLRNFQEYDRLAFAQLCVAYDMWVEATREMQKPNGKVRLVKTVSGDQMERVSPWVTIQTIAFRQCQEMFEQFGMTPLDRARLLRDRAALSAGLWDQGAPADPATAPTAAETTRETMDIFDSEGPTPLPN